MWPTWPGRHMPTRPRCREVEGAWGRVGMFFPGPPLSPRPGAPSVPPSPADPGPPTGRTPKVKNVFRFKLDAKSVPEALATTILILLKFSIVLAHRWNPRVWPHPAPSGTPHRHPWAPLVTPGAHGTTGGGARLPNSATQKTIIQLLFQFFSGVRNSGWGGRGVQAIPPTAEFFNKKTPTSHLGSVWG